VFINNVDKAAKSALLQHTSVSYCDQRTDGRTDGRTELRQQYHALHYMPHGKH